eukprot:4904481-Prymnesium_polylepis.2
MPRALKKPHFKGVGGGERLLWRSPRDQQNEQVFAQTIEPITGNACTAVKSSAVKMLPRIYHPLPEDKLHRTKWLPRSACW